MHIITKLLLITTSFSSFSNIKLLDVKFNLNNLKSFQLDPIITYQQNNKGSLQVTKNTKTKDIIKSKNDDVHFLVKLSHGNKVGVERINNYISELRFDKKNDLYFTLLGSKEVEKIGKGKNLKVHLNAEYFSFFEPSAKKIIVKKRSNQLEYSIRINNIWNPYFQPSVALDDSLNLYFTEYSAKGSLQIISYNLKSKKKKLIKKLKSINKKFNICFIEDKQKILIMEYELDFLTKTKSLIYDLYNTKYYETDYKLTGALECTEKGFYFIKEKNKNLARGEQRFELLEYQFNNSSLNTLKKSNFLPSLFKQNNKVFVQIEKNIFEVI